MFRSKSTNAVAPAAPSHASIAKQALDSAVAKSALDADSGKALGPKLMSKAAKPERLDARAQKVANFLAKHFHIANEASVLIVSEAYKAGKVNKADPLLVLSVIGIESQYNPLAASSVGAMGLTQTLPKAHPEKIAKLGAGGHILNIADNIQMGSAALGEYLRRFHGNEVLALQQYNGSLDDHSRVYSAKVLALRAKILRACA